MLTPTNETDLAEAVKWATGPLRVRGGGTRLSQGALGGEDLSVAGLSGITLYDPGALTLVMGAGTPLAEVEAVLAAEGQRLAFEPGDLRAVLGTVGVPTVGGMVATNASGPRRVQAGACRDSLIGVRFVDGTGQVIKNGGRVMKNVTGYDLVKLMAGSHGTLGVLSEVAFKLLPTPEAVATLVIAGLEDSMAVAALSAALGSPFEVTGAAHAPEGPEGTPSTMVRIEGFADSVAYRADALTGLLGRYGAVQVLRDPEQVTALWRWVRDVEGMAGTPGDVWRFSVKPSDGPALVARLGAERVLYDWGGGLVWAESAPGTDLRAAMGDLGGHATRMRGADLPDVPRFHPEPAAIAALNSGLRARFDPRGILNPGLMG